MLRTDTSITPPPPDLMPGAPAGFTRFTMPGRQRQAQLLNRYLWDFFVNRAINMKAPYFKEYLQVADLWLDDAVEPRTKRAIQDQHEDELNSIYQDDEGYLSSHQLLSQTHDHGWPFPFWCWPMGHDGHTRAWVWTTPYGQPAIFPHWQQAAYTGQAATEGWTLHNMTSRGVVNDRWVLEANGPAPSITSPMGQGFDSFCAPFIQLRAICHSQPHLMNGARLYWKRTEDAEFTLDRSMPMLIDAYGHNDRGVNAQTGTNHCVAKLYDHPLYNGQIEQIRIAFNPEATNETFWLADLFTAYDTRHPINNPIFIIACWMQFLWTGDIEFLKRNVDRMRRALRWQQKEMNTLKHNHVRNTLPGHDGRPGFRRAADGTLTIHWGHGVGNNYFDICPFGYDDAYATAQYYRMIMVMAEVEDAVRRHPEWGIAPDTEWTPRSLRRHAEAVKRVFNTKFWDNRNGRFIACIDADGKKWDFGYTFVNLEAIWYDAATPQRARQIFEWLDGKRIVEGDTSTGKDIYFWRFAPRISTRRNLEWYGQGWYAPETVPWGDQVQDGGAVLGFAFYDLIARLRVMGPDDAWNRLMSILQWEQEVRRAGGYRAYYAQRNVTLQGGGTAGGIGIDVEFLESSMLPAIIPLGFLGLEPDADALWIRPKLPKAQPQMGIHGILYRGATLDIQCSNREITIAARRLRNGPVQLRLDAGWRIADKPARILIIDRPGCWTIRR